MSISSACRSGELIFIDRAPAAPDVRKQAIEGLATGQKVLPCALLYDEAGSALFERITRLPEYYPTRTEVGILQHNLPAIQAEIGPAARVVELGSGAATKTRILLAGLAAAEYVAVDIARAQLQESAAAIACQFPDIDVYALCADYMNAIDLPVSSSNVSRTAVFFPGSTIGNFEPADAAQFLRRLRDLSGKGGGLLIGVDLIKDRVKLERAYNDTAGVTAAFNLNALARLNREAGATFDLTAFEHRAIYDDRAHRIEMHLISRRNQCVAFPGATEAKPEHICLRAGESIVTEHSYKYSVESFRALARDAGWQPRRTWTDERAMFSLHWLTRESADRAI